MASEAPVRSGTLDAAEMQDSASTTSTAQTKTNSAGEKQHEAQDVAAPQDNVGEAAAHGDVQKSEEAVEAAVDQKPKRSKGQITLIMIALALSCFLAALDITIVTTALPTISTYFQSTTAYTWVGSSYLLATAGTTMIWGKLSDVFGRKPILLTANAIFFVGSLLSALSVNVTMLLVARSIQGVGGAGLNNLVNICIADLFNPRERGAFMSVVSLVWALALSLGPIIGGAFTEFVTWRWCFYINLPLDGLAFIITFFFLDIQTPRTPLIEGLKSIDWIGSALSLGGTLMFLFGISFGGDRNPWNSPTVICLIVFGVVAWVLFIFYEAYFAKYPLLPTSIFKHQAPLALLGICFLQSFVYLGVVYYLPLYFQTVLDAAPILSGVYLLPIAIPLSLAAIAGGLYMRKTGKYQPPIWIGFFTMTLGFGLLIDIGPTANWPLIIFGEIILAAGCGPLFQGPMIALQSLVPQGMVASATSCFAFIRLLSGAVAIVIGQVVFQNELRKSTGILQQTVNPQLAAALSSGAAGANTDAIAALPDAQRYTVHQVLTDAMRGNWIMFTAFCAAALTFMWFIGKNTLSSKHEETKTGLEAEKEARAVRLAQEKAKRVSKLGAGAEAKA